MECLTCGLKLPMNELKAHARECEKEMYVLCVVHIGWGHNKYINSGKISHLQDVSLLQGKYLHHLHSLDHLDTYLGHR